jgi:DNA (cytosine-5)-methyltransferase 1
MLKAISLFSGIGGLDEGLHRAGFAPVFCSEIDPHAFESLQYWCRQKKLNPDLGRDIRDFCPEILLKQLELVPGEIDLLSGGPPCQSFSLIGSRNSLDDDRGILLFKMINYASVFLPKAVLIEQVKGLLSAKGPDGKAGSVLSSLIGCLSDLGYTVKYRVLRAADYGAPQLRDRVILVALRGNKEFDFPEPSHCDPSNKIFKQTSLFGLMKPYLTVQDAIADLPSPPQKGERLPDIPSHLDITPKRDRERINGVPEGECLARQFHLPKDQRMRLDPEKDTTKFRRMAWGKPALTLRGGEAFYHPSENRYLTPREYMRLHGFSDSHLLFGPIRARSGTVRNLDQHRLVANAVPPPLAHAVGDQIRRYIT